MTFGNIQILVRIVVACIGGAVLAQASVIYSNFSSTPPGYTSEGWSFSATPGPPPYYPIKNSWAMAFTLSSDAVLNSAILPLTIHSGDVRVFLMDSAGDETPGAVIDSFVVPLPTSPAPQLFSGQFLTNPYLKAGQTWWLAAEIDEDDGFAHWYAAYLANSGMGTGRAATRWPFSIDPSWQVGTYRQSAFQLEGEFLSAVPEPGYGLVSCGILVGLLAFLKPKRESPDRRTGTSAHSG